MAARRLTPVITPLKGCAATRTKASPARPSVPLLPLWRCCPHPGKDSSAVPCVYANTPGRFCGWPSCLLLPLPEKPFSRSLPAHPMLPSHSPSRRPSPDTSPRAEPCLPQLLASFHLFISSLPTLGPETS